MKLTRTNLIALLALSLLAPVAAVAEEAHERHMTIEELPSPVRTTVLKLANGQRISEIEQETQRGKEVYKVKIGANEIMLHASGRVLSMKTERAEDQKPGEKSEKDKDSKEKEAKEHNEKEEQEKESKERH
jgi:hypothetical protein